MCIRWQFQKIALEGRRLREKCTWLENCTAYILHFYYFMKVGLAELFLKTLSG